MNKTVAIIQSSYIPWKGYFDIINRVDEFILFDDVQYTKRDWRSRNKINTPNGYLWLTIPVVSKSRYYQKIDEVIVADTEWCKKHFDTLKNNYAKASYFKQMEQFVADLYNQCRELDKLSEINYHFIKKISHFLNIKTLITWSMNYGESNLNKTERLVELCKKAGATKYLSGPAAKAYLEISLFEEENITVEYMNYEHYPEYPQLFSPFVHDVSILDLIFNTGDQAYKYMKSFSDE